MRQQILDAARDLFVREGYQSTSIRKIASRANCAVGTIYLHFRDKQDVLEALSEELFTRLDRRMEAIAADLSNDATSDPLEALRRGLRVYIEFGLEHRHHYFLVFMLPPDQLAHSGRESILALGIQSFSHMVAIVSRCMEAERIPRADPNEISQALWCGAHGIVSLFIAKCEFPFIEQTRLIERLLAVLIDGVRA